MNWKQLGDIAQGAVIGKLAEYGIICAVPMTDNLPFDIIAVANNKLYRIQVKGSSVHKNGSIIFGLGSNNWYTGERTDYDLDKCDIICCYDYIKKDVYILQPEDFKNKRSFAIRYKPTSNGNQVQCNQQEDYIISTEKIKTIFNFESINVTEHYKRIVNGDNKYSKSFNKICEYCKKEFTTRNSKKIHCSSECKNDSRLKITWPTIEKLSEMIKVMPIKIIAAKLGVSSHTVEKRCKKLGINYKIHRRGFWVSQEGLKLVKENVSCGDRTHDPQINLPL